MAAYHLLSMRTPTLGPHVLPNLLHIMWEDTWEAMPFLRLFLTPGLVSAHIEFPDCLPHPYHLAVVSLIPTRHLAHLRLDLIPSGNENSFLEALRNLLDEASETLRSVRLDGEISTTIFDKLLRLHNLRYLSVKLPQAPISPLEVAFPYLEKLVVWSREVSPWLHILEKIPNPALQRFKITFSEDSPPTDFQALCHSLICANKEQTLTSIKCSWERAITITEVELRPLLPFARLTKLVLLSRCYGECTVQLEDPFICTLAIALPRLETLIIGDALCDAVTQVTVESLVELSANCVNLDFLQLHVDATNIPSRGTRVNSQIRKSSCKLRTLSVGSRPLPPHHDDILLVTFVIIHLFPHVENVFGAGEGWEKVNRGLELFREASTIIPPFP